MNYTHLTFEQRYHIELGWRRDLCELKFEVRPVFC